MATEWSNAPNQVLLGLSDTHQRCAILETQKKRWVCTLAMIMGSGTQEPDQAWK